MRKRRGKIIFLCWMIVTTICSQNKKQIDLESVLNFYSLQSVAAENLLLEFKNSALSDVNARKEFLPTLSFTLNPFNFNRSLRTLQDPKDGSYNYIKDYSNNSTAGVTLSQKIPYLNGDFSISSRLNILSELSREKYSFSSTPYRLGYNQQLRGSWKSFKLDQKIKSLKHNNLIP